MDTGDGAVDHELRQSRLSTFGRVLAVATLIYVVLTFSASIWLGRLSFNRSSIPLVVATVASAALWLLLRGAPRSPRFVRNLLIYVLLVYAVYVPSTARHTLVVASLMTVPLLGSIFVAFRRRV